MFDQFGHRAAVEGDHRGAAGHRLDHRQAEGLVEADEVEERTRLAERPRAGFAADDAAEDHVVVVDVRRDLTLVIAFVLHQASHDQPLARSLRGGDGVVRAFVGMDAAEEEQVVAALCIEGEVIEGDAVVDRRGVAERRVAVGVADRDVMHMIVVALVHRHDPLGREAVDRRQHRRVDQPRPGERHEIGLVVDQVELARLFHAIGDVQRLPHLGVEVRGFGIAARGDALQLAGGVRILRGEEGDVDAARDQRLGKEARDQLPRAVAGRRRRPRDRGQHGDAHQFSSSTMNPSSPSIRPSKAVRVPVAAMIRLAGAGGVRFCASGPRLSATYRRWPAWTRS